MGVQQFAPTLLFSRYYAITVSFLVVPLSLLLASIFLHIVTWYTKLPANVSKPTFFIYWLNAVLNKPKITFLAAVFIGVVLLTPAIFQILHKKAHYCLPTIIAGVVSCGIYIILVA